MDDPTLNLRSATWQKSNTNTTQSTSDNQPTTPNRLLTRTTTVRTTRGTQTTSTTTPTPISLNSRSTAPLSPLTLPSNPSNNTSNTSTLSTPRQSDTSSLLSPRVGVPLPVLPSSKSAASPVTSLSYTLSSSSTSVISTSNGQNKPTVVPSLALNLNSTHSNSPSSSNVAQTPLTTRTYVLTPEKKALIEKWAGLVIDQTTKSKVHYAEIEAQSPERLGIGAKDISAYIAESLKTKLTPTEQDKKKPDNPDSVAFRLSSDPETIVCSKYLRALAGKIIEEKVICYFSEYFNGLNANDSKNLVEKSDRNGHRAFNPLHVKRLSSTSIYNFLECFEEITGKVGYLLQYLLTDCKTVLESLGYSEEITAKFTNNLTNSCLSLYLINPAIVNKVASLEKKIKQLEILKTFLAEKDPAEVDQKISAKVLQVQATLLQEIPKVAEPLKSICSQKTRRDDNIEAVVSAIDSALKNATGDFQRHLESLRNLLDLQNNSKNEKKIAEWLSQFSEELNSVKPGLDKLLKNILHKEKSSSSDLNTIISAIDLLLQKYNTQKTTLTGISTIVKMILQKNSIEDQFAKKLKDGILLEKRILVELHTKYSASFFEKTEQLIAKGFTTHRIEKLTTHRRIGSSSNPNTNTSNTQSPRNLQ